MSTQRERINIGLEVAPLSEVPPNTLILFENSAGIWFRQHRGAVGPKGQTPTFFGDPEVDIFERVEYEPSSDAERWRYRNRGRVAVMSMLRRGYDGDSHPTDIRSSIREKRFIPRSQLNKMPLKFISDEVLEEMANERLIVEGWTTPGLSIHSESEHAFMLTAQGMAEAVRRGVGEDFAAGRMRQLMYRAGL